MRIAFFVHSFPAISETFILRQVTGLLDRGHTVEIFAFQPASDGPLHEAVEKYGLRRLVRMLPRTNDVAETNAVRSLTRSLRVLLSARGRRSALSCLTRDHARALGGWRILVQTLATLSEHEPFDIVHCHYGDIGLHCRVAARLWPAPLIASFYGYDCSSYPRARGARVFEPLFSTATAVTSLSEHMDGRLHELGCPARLLERVPLAVDPAYQSAQPRPMRVAEPVHLLTIGRLTEKKGIEFALRALALVINEFPELQYDIIGAGPLLANLATLARSLGVSANVRFLGSRTDEYVREALRGADLFLLPSVTAANGDQEGTPTAVLEAAFAGLPVLSTLHAGIPELVLNGESGYLVPERDPHALADRLRTLLRSPEQWRSMGDAGRRHVERNHTTAAVAERLDRLYTRSRASLTSMRRG